MKRYLFLMFIVFESCSYNIELRDVDVSDRLFITCFPGERDTTNIFLSVVTPSNLEPSVKQLNNLSLEMKYNDESVAITKANENGRGDYYAVLPDNPRGTISLRASVDGVESALANSVFPGTPVVDISCEEDSGYINFQITLEDDPAADNWYGLRFHRKEETVEYYEESGYFSCNKHEIGLNVPWFIFGEAGGVTYDDFLKGRMRSEINGEEMFLFTDKEAKGKAISINLLVDYSKDYINSYISREYQNLHYRQLIVTRYFNEIEVFSLSKEMYKYFETLFKIENNELAGIGLAPASFAAGNVLGGYGVVGCCNKFCSGWLHNIEGIPEFNDYEDAWRFASRIEN